MKSIRTTCAVATLAMVLGGTALAQPGPMSGAGMSHAHGEHMHEHKAERHASRLNELKTRLKLVAGQESAWKTFAEAMQPPARHAGRMERAAMEKLTTPERIDQMQALHAQHDVEMKKRGDATKAFYATLSAEQKKTFDAETTRFVRVGMGMHRH